MSVKRETEEPIEQPDDGNLGHPHSHSAALRKRILAFFLIVLCALMSGIYVYYQSAYLRRAGDWRWFWVGEVFTGAWLIFAVVQGLRKGP